MTSFGSGRMSLSTSLYDVNALSRITPLNLVSSSNSAIALAATAAPSDLPYTKVLVYYLPVVVRKISSESLFSDFSVGVPVLFVYPLYATMRTSAERSPNK